jgi:hypothetical protein
VVKARATELAEVLQRVGAAAYAASAAAGEAGSDGSGPEAGPEEGAGVEDETVEGEFKEV